MSIIMIIIIYIVWIAIAVSMMSNISPYAYELKFWHKVVVFLTILIGAPIILLAQAIEAIIQSFMPDGWEDDDNDKFKQ